MNRGAKIRMDMGLYIDDSIGAHTKVFIQGPCRLASEETVTVTHMSYHEQYI